MISVINYTSSVLSHYFPGLVAIFGNILVFGLQVTWLKNADDNVNVVGKMNRILVLNLSCADFLVGVSYVRVKGD